MAPPREVAGTGTARVAPLRTLPETQPHPCAGNLPQPVSSFVGRRDEVVAVAELLGRSRLVTVCGPGGMGKTRVAIEAARARQGAQHGGAWVVDLGPMGDLEGAWMVELAPVSDPDLVPHAVLAELADLAGERDADRERGRPSSDLVRYLRGRRALLVLDNCEHVLDSCVTLVGRLLGACPDLSILTTSRQPLGIPGERVWWLAPLPVDSDAVTLFAERAGEVHRDFALTAASQPVVAEICRRLDGLPLAIELAAARAAMLSPEEILARLDDRFALLAGGSVSGAGGARQRTLRATLDWSHDLLSPAEATFLRRLSVFAGGWSLDAATAVCCDEDLPAGEALDLTAALMAKSLIVAGRLGTPTRYRMLESVRAYAKDRLLGAGEVCQLRAAHAGWCVARAEEAHANREGNAHETWLRALDEDHDNFRAALGWSRDNGQVELALRLADSLAWFWQTRGHLREGLDWLQSVLDASECTEHQPSPARAGVMRNVGRFLHMLGDHRSGMALIDRSVTLFASLGQADEAGGCVCHDVLQMCRNPQHAAPMMEANLDGIRAMDDPNRLAHALSNLGQARFFLGDAAGAKACFAEVMDLEPDRLDTDARQEAVLGLARVALLVGDLDTAEPLLQTALANAERAADPDERSCALSLLGEVARARGDTVGARTLLTTALALALDGAAAISIGRCELFLGHVEFSEGELGAAQARYAQALRRAQAGATQGYHQVRCLLGLAEVAAATGQTVLAESYFDEAADAAEANGDASATARALAGQADLASASGDLDAALLLRHQALEVEKCIGDLRAIAASFDHLAELATGQGQADKGARLLGASAALRQHIGMVRAAPADKRMAAATERTRRALGDNEWQASLEQGASLTLDQAISYARKGRGRRGRPSLGRESLTPAERDVIALVAKGLTNPEVGEQLFISRRTVGNHLGRIYTKLGIKSRRELMRVFSGEDGHPPAEALVVVRP